MEDPRKAAGMENGQQGAINKVATLPLVSAAYKMVSATYSSAKESHPAIQAVCDMAETGVKTMATSAMSGAQPLLYKLEPPIAAANFYASKGLDKLQGTLPSLQQTVGKVVLDTKDLVVGAKDSICSKVTEVKDVMVGVAKGTTQASMKIAKSAVTSGVSTSLAVVTGGVDKVIEKSEELVDHYLPITNEELVSLAASLQWDETTMVPIEKHKQQQSYYVQLGSLSTKVRGRAYQHSLGKLQKAKQSSQEMLVQLQQAIDSMKHTKQAVDQKLQDSQEKLKEIWQIWKKSQPVNKNEANGEANGELNGEVLTELESKALVLSHGLAEKLHTICQNLLVDTQGLPVALQKKIKETHRNLEELQVAFSGAQSFHDISNNLLVQSKEKMVKAQETVNELQEFVPEDAPFTRMVSLSSPAKLADIKEEEQK